MIGTRTTATRVMATALTLLGLGTGVAGAQPETGMSYDPKAETTLEGIVDDVMTMPGTSAMSGVHVALKTDREAIHVHLGPADFLERLKASFKSGDRLTVTGSRIKGQGFEAILARSVKKGRSVITLRDERGVPLWATGGR